MSEMHPKVRLGLSMMRELKHRIAEMQERGDAIVARRPSPSGMVIPEVDAYGQLRDLYLAPGTSDRFDSEQLVAEIMAAITDSTLDAQRQYHRTMNDPSWRPPPFEEVMRRWQPGTEPDWRTPIAGKSEE
ncbi:YbaB/EbfC family nucleoid-associated protein [Nocardia sp. NPDC004722]